jgi:hypothetical protein
MRDYVVNGAKATPLDRSEIRRSLPTWVHGSELERQLQKAPASPEQLERVPAPQTRTLSVEEKKARATTTCWMAARTTAKRRRPKAGLHKRSAEDWGSPLRRAIGAQPSMSFLPCQAQECMHCVFCLIKAAVVFGSASSYGVGNRAAFSDSRSNFHTRIGYRTNVCRRRLASDLARASEGTPAQGAHEDHHDRLPGSPRHRSQPMRRERLLSCCHAQASVCVDYLQSGY